MIPVFWTTVDFPDGATFLSHLMGGDIPPDWLPSGVLSSVDELQGMPTGPREDATRELGERLTREIVPAVAYARERTSAYFSPRLGCRSFPPFGFGVDLAALCIVNPQSDLRSGRRRRRTPAASSGSPRSQSIARLTVMSSSSNPRAA